MNRWKVSDVMTAPVVSVHEDASFKEIVELLADRRVSAVPVVDAVGRVLGVVSEADLLYKVELADRREVSRLFETRRRRTAREKAAADDAGYLMSAPAITITGDTTLVQAARLMDAEQVKRLPVVGPDGRLVGIVSRKDLLKMFLRSDAEIAEDVSNEVLRRALWLAPHEVVAEVDDGVVTLRGELERRSLITIAIRLTRSIEGVVDVVDRLTYYLDDTELLKSGRFYDPIEPR
jgi:CBS domain-containing protein